jgi:hypothetical protein
MKYVLGAIFSFLLIACGSTNFKKVGDGGLIAFSLESTGLGAKGKGGILTLKNTQTGDTISTNSLSPFSAHCIAANVPPGTYMVSKIQVSVGSYMYSNWSDEVGKYWGEILVESNVKIYLGQFKGERAIGAKNVLKIERAEESMPKRQRCKRSRD